MKKYFLWMLATSVGTILCGMLAIRIGIDPPKFSYVATLLLGMYVFDKL